MESCRRLCFLVLAVSCVSKGQNVSSSHENADSPASMSTAGPTQSLARAGNQTTFPTASPSSSQHHTSATETHPRSTVSMTRKETAVMNDSGSETPAPPPAASGPAPGSVSGADNSSVSTPTNATKPANQTISKPVAEEAGHSSWGYVILVLILLVIVALLVILCLLRRASRSYSFDLQRPGPVNHLDEPAGTFEPVYLDHLDQPAPKDQETPDDLSSPAVTDGTTRLEENAPQEQPGANGVTTPPVCNANPSADRGPGDQTADRLDNTNQSFDAIGDEQKNENNNSNPCQTMAVCSSDPFVEINLNEPAPCDHRHIYTLYGCDQLLASPEAPSSVLPFSPFSVPSS